LILIVGGVLYGFYLKPKYEGEVQLKSIQDQTTVYFDDFGVPHIYANNSIDAMTALGYVHAQDRLWQMELMRRIAPGRLSEIFGKVALKNDTFLPALVLKRPQNRRLQI
jgi:penicillin amidase